MSAANDGHAHVTAPFTGARLLLGAVLVLGLLGVVASRASADNVTVSGDPARTGWYASEPRLTPSQVTAGDFGRQFATALDGSVYAQPLVVGGTVVVTTEKASAYGVSASTGAILWTRHFGSPFQSASIGCGDLTPNLGSTSTPVYDTATGTVYLTTKLADGATIRKPHWYLQAISLATGAERPGYPVLLQGTADNDPTVTFDPFVEHQRAGLLLAGGVVYIGFGSHCDIGAWRGWVLAVGVGASPHMQSVWTTEVANGSGAGVWQAGGGLVSDGNDSAGKPRVFLATGNGISPPPGLGTTPTGLLGDSVVRLGLDASGHLTARDFFAPANAPTLDQNDLDLGSGGPVALPDSFGTASHPHLLVEDGKDGRVFLLDRDRLGGRGQGVGGRDAALQVLGPSRGVWGHPAVYGAEGGWVYYVENGGPLRAYRRTTTSGGDPVLAAVGNSAGIFGYTSGSPIVTSSGTTAGSALVWVVSSTGTAGLDARLQAYDAVPTSGTLRLRWSAPIGVASKFAVPAAAGGRVFVGTRDGKLLAFGRPAATPLTGRPVDFGNVATGTTGRTTATFIANTSLTVTAAQTSAPFGVDTAGLGLPRAVTAGQALVVPVTFAPGSPGAATATLTLVTSAGPAAADLHGVGTQPGLGAGPAALDFGTVPTHSSSMLTVSVTNTGTTPETLSAVTAPRGSFTAVNLPVAGSVVPAGESFAVSVTYTPVAAGPSSDSFAITSTSGTLTVPLTGIGEVGQGVLTLTPAATDFGNVVVGTSRTLGFDISNTGNIPLTITLAKAPSGAFSAVNPLSEGVTLSPGDVVHQQVTFTPTTSGRGSATYTVNADTGQPAQIETLVGTGVTGTTLAPPTGSAWTRNGSATVSGTDLVLTPADHGKAGSAFSRVAFPSEGLSAHFTASIGGGTGADGMTFTLLDASQPATSLGAGGGGLGYGGLPGAVAVTLDTYQNGLDPSANFVGVADGVSARGKATLRYLATSTDVRALTAGTHDVGVDVYGGRLRVTVDSDLKIDAPVTLPAYVRPGFTAATGAATDRHLVRGARVTSPQLKPDITPPTVMLTGPTGGTVRAAVTVAASAIDDGSGTARVAFSLDGRPLGGRVTAPPYQVPWDTTRVLNGRHTLSATAMDAAGNTATSRPVTVTVNNPLPVDASVSVNGHGTLTVSALSTSRAGDLLLALVSSHGPNRPGGQSMTLSGGGLTWTLVKRAAGVRGTSEVWQARAPRVLSGATVTARPSRAGYDGSLTVLALSGTKAATTGTGRSAATGAPSVALATAYAGSWVVGVGNDPTTATTRRPAAGQTLLYQRVDSRYAVTFWFQVSSPAVPARTTTRLADTAPTKDAWNLVAVEVPRAT
jgi:Bacterial lectin/Bacterial Ig domain/Abnormal spindle-like microcephaly-assoc'd, ASPM-SPD-2-Hydin/PQQ-like domain